MVSSIGSTDALSDRQDAYPTEEDGESKSQLEQATAAQRSSQS